MGSMGHVDEPVYISGEYSEKQKSEIIKEAERIIEAAGEDYKSSFLEEHQRLIARVMPS